MFMGITKGWAPGTDTTYPYEVTTLFGAVIGILGYEMYTLNTFFRMKYQRCYILIR